MSGYCVERCFRGYPVTEIKHDLTRTTLAVLFIGALIAVSFWVMRPFLPATVWGAMIVIATWPIMLRVQARLWNSRKLAVVVMTIALLLVLVLPLSLAIISIVENADQISVWARSLTSFEMPPAPEWLGRLPLVGGGGGAGVGASRSSRDRGTGAEGSALCRQRNEMVHCPGRQRRVRVRAFPPYRRRRGHPVCERRARRGGRSAFRSSPGGRARRKVGDAWRAKPSAAWRLA